MALYETYSIQGETLSDIAEAIREKTETNDPIETTNMSNMIRGISGGSPNAVLFIEQNLTEEQKAQARENIGAAKDGIAEGAVLYTEQSLQPEQKDQARKNIDLHVGEEPQNADDGAVWFDPDAVTMILGNVIMAEDLNEGHVEVFGSLMNEDTVVAKDENSDGNINLEKYQSANTDLENYVTREEFQNLSIDDIGAAPAGYGLGTQSYSAEASTTSIKDKATLDSLLGNRFWAYRNTSDYLISDDSETRFVYGIHYQYSPSYATQIGYCVYNGAMIRRTFVSSAWSEWEYENPPMISDKEYRTTDRIDEQTVYKKRDANGDIFYRLDGSDTWEKYNKLIGLDYTIIKDFSRLGLSGEVTMNDIYAAMPQRSMFFFTQSNSNTNRISDSPFNYGFIEIIKDTKYGHARATKCTSNAVEHYIGAYYDYSDAAFQGFSGWKKEIVNGSWCTSITTTGTDLNDYQTDGWYWFSSSYTPTNIPSGVTNGWLQVISTGTLTKQVWYRMGTAGTNDHQTFVRTRNGSTWGAWKQFLTSGDFTMQYNIYRDLSGLGLTSPVTIQQVYNTMPNYSVVYITHSGSTISDAPTTYCLIELVKANKYGFAKASQINSTSPRYYEGWWYDGTFGGWRQSMTTILTESVEYGTTLPTAGTKGRIFFKKVGS